MKMDLKKFKKVAEDQHSTTMAHPDGHTIQVAHKGLHPATRGQLAALPMAKGGKVDPTTEHLLPGDKNQNKIEKEVVSHQSARMAEGGQVPSERQKKQELVDESQSDEMSSMLMQEPPREPLKPKMAEGGPVPQPEESAPISINTDPNQISQIDPALINPNPGSQAQMSPALPPGVNEMTPQQQAASNPGALPFGVSPEAAAPEAPKTPEAAPQGSATTPQTQPTAGTQADPYGNSAYQESYMKGLDSQKAGLEMEAKAAQDQGEAQAKLLGKQQGIQAAQQTDYQTHYRALDAERQALQADIQNQHIDPNHFVNSMDGASKISTAIGLIASGMGGAMSHQGSMAADFLHKQIDNDIQAQKANLGKSENLLSANMRQFGNLRDATDMTRVMQSDILANKLRTEAAKQMGPMAKANLLKAAGELEMKSAPVLSQIAMRKSLMSGMQAGRVAPEAVIRMIVPEHEQAGATKELKEAQNMYKAKDNIISAFDKIAQLNTVGNRMGSPLQTPRQVAALKDPIVAGLSKETAGRFTEQDAHMLDSLFPATGDDTTTLSTKRAQTIKLITEKLNFPELKKWGIDLSNSGRYDNTGKSRIPEGKPKR